MENWPEISVSKEPINADEFADLLSIFRAWMAGKSAKMVKLGVRLDSTYQSLTAVKQREFTRLLIAEGEIRGKLAEDIEFFKGRLVKLTMERKLNGNDIRTEKSS